MEAISWGQPSPKCAKCSRCATCAKCTSIANTLCEAFMRISRTLKNLVCKCNIDPVKIRNHLKLAIIGILFVLNIIYIFGSLLVSKCDSLPNYFLFALIVNWGILYFYFLTIKICAFFKYFKLNTSVIFIFNFFLEKSLQKFNCGRGRWSIVLVVFRCIIVVFVIIASLVLFIVQCISFRALRIIQNNLKRKVLQ